MAGLAPLGGDYTFFLTRAPLGGVIGFWLFIREGSF